MTIAASIISSGDTFFTSISGNPNAASPQDLIESAPMAGVPSTMKPDVTAEQSHSSSSWRMMISKTSSGSRSTPCMSIDTPPQDERMAPSTFVKATERSYDVSSPTSAVIVTRATDGLNRYSRSSSSPPPRIPPGSRPCWGTAASTASICNTRSSLPPTDWPRHSSWARSSSAGTAAP